jgi:hypothetical protein
MEKNDKMDDYPNQPCLALGGKEKQLGDLHCEEAHLQAAPSPSAWQEVSRHCEQSNSI